MVGAVSTFRLGCIGVAFVGVAALGNAAVADDEDSSAARQDYLSLDHLDAYLEFKGEFTRTMVTSRDLTGARQKRTQKNTDYGFEERVGLKLGGTVLDPGFITFAGDFSFALTQDRYEEKISGYGTRTDDDNGYLVHYDARVNFLQGKILSGSLYALRRDDRINRRFQPTLDEERTGFGTNWVFAHDKIPMELSYDYLETDRTGNWYDGDDEHYTESTFHWAADWLVSEHRKFSLSYEHGETKQEYQGLDDAFETTRDLVKLTHDWEFGSESQHSLRSFVRWQEESGDFARDLYESSQQLTLHHSDSLQTMYTYQHNRERYEELDIDTHRADFQLVHQMYSNLTTTVDVFGLYEDIEDDVETVQYGAAVDWQYNRRNRFGHLNANLALAYDTEDISGDNGRRIVLDESGTFRDPLSIILRNRNVVQATILVTDATNRRYLRPGVDYVVSRQGNVTRLLRLRTGQIADGDTVLIDYEYRTPADGKIDTMRVDFNVEQRFTFGLTPYYRWSYRNQENEGSTGFARWVDRTNHHRLGVNYEQERFSLGAEFEIFDDTVDPYDAVHVNGLLHVVRSPDHNLDLSSRFSRMCFEDDSFGRDVTMVDVELDHRWRLTESLSTVERIAYRFEDDSVAGDTNSWDVTAGLEYIVGDFSGELTVEYDRLGLPESEEEDFGVYFRVRRDIPNVLAKW